LANHSEIYRNQAEKYELLISKQPSLYETIEGIKSVKGLDMLGNFKKLGCKTGKPGLLTTESFLLVTTVQLNCFGVEYLLSRKYQY
jgi:hypothetical protein